MLSLYHVLYSLAQKQIRRGSDDKLFDELTSDIGGFEYLRPQFAKKLQQKIKADTFIYTILTKYTYSTKIEAIVYIDTGKDTGLYYVQIYDDITRGDVIIRKFRTLRFKKAYKEVSANG